MLVMRATVLQLYTRLKLVDLILKMWLIFSHCSDRPSDIGR